MAHNDGFDDLEVSSSFTDPGGTTHTGTIGGASLSVENTDGTALVSDVTAIQAGTDLDFSDDGDDTATLDYTGTAGGGVNVENTDGTTLLTTETVQAGTELQFSDDGDGTATLDFTGTHYTAENARDDIASALTEGTDIAITHDDPNDTITIDYTGTSSGGVTVENTDGTALVADATAIQAGTDLQFGDDGDGTATLDYTGSSGGNEEVSSETQSSDGTTTTYTISHGLGTTPSYVDVTPATEDAMANFYIANESSSSFDIVYASAPPSGTDNLSWYWAVYP